MKREYEAEIRATMFIITKRKERKCIFKYNGCNILIDNTILELKEGSGGREGKPTRKDIITQT